MRLYASVFTALAGEIRGNQVSVTSIKGDIINDRTAVVVGYGSGNRTLLDQGSQITARQQLDLSAGRDLTNLGQLASAGRDIDLLAVQDHTFTQSAIRRGLVTNDTVQTLGSSVTTGGNLELNAKRDIVIASAQDEQSSTFYQKKKGSFGLSKSGNSRTSSTTTQVGSELSAGNDAVVIAGTNVNLSASSIEAKRDAEVRAGLVDKNGDINLMDAANTSSSQSDKYKSKVGLSSSSGFISVASGKKSGQEHLQSQSVGSVVSAGRDTTLQAAREVNMIGSTAAAVHDLKVGAGRDVNVLAGSNSQDQSHWKSEKHTGLSLSSDRNGVTAFLGHESLKEKSRNAQETVAPSQLLAGQDATIKAGRDLTLEGSRVDAKRDVNLQAGHDINIDAGKETSIEERSKSRDRNGLTGNVSHNFGNTMDALKGTGKGEDGVSKTSSEQMSQGTRTPSVLLAGRDVSLEARDNLTLVGTQVQSGRDIDLSAGKDLTIRAAENDSSSESKRHSGGGEVGPALGGKDFVSVYASVDMGKGKLEREGQAQQNAHLVAGDQLRFSSGKDTTIAGATLRGGEVIGRVGGDLTVSSVPDTGKASGKQMDASVTVSIGLGGGGSVSGSLGMGKTTGKTNWVQEQTSITGKNGVDIRTENHTQLDGALLAADNGKLKLDTGTLGFRDIAGEDKEHSYYLNAGGTFGWGGDGAKSTGGKDVAFTTDKSLEGRGKTGASGWSVSGYDYRKEREQEVRATVGAGTITVRNDAKTGVDSTAGLNRDVSQAYEITKDKEKRTDLYVSQSSLESVNHPIQTLNQWKEGMKNYGKNTSGLFTQFGDLSKAADQVVADNPSLLPLAWIPGLLETVLDKAGKYTGGVMPGVENHGGLITQVPALITGDMRFYRVETKYQYEADGKTIKVDPVSGKPMIENVQKLMEIERPDGDRAVFTNGIQNSLMAALVNGAMQTGSDSFMQAYNPEHGILGDLVESLWDVALGGTVRSGNAQQLHDFFQAGIKDEYKLDVAGHSQGGLLTYRAISGLDFNLNGQVGSIQLSGAPVGSKSFFEAADAAGFDIGNGAFFQVNRPGSKTFFGMLPVTDTVSDLLGQNFTHSSDPVARFFGSLATSTSLMGVDSPHSNYLCVAKGMCGDAPNALQDQFKKNPRYIEPTFIDANGKDTIRR